MLSTFMEVLDTTVVNVSLPHIAGQPLGHRRRSYLDFDFLSRGECHHPAAHRLALQFFLGRKRMLMLSVIGFTNRVFLVRALLPVFPFW